MDEQSKRGRPHGTRRSGFVANRSFRLTQPDLDALRDLAGLWLTTEAEAMRRAVRETLKREAKKARLG